jgi:hypothetical protein
MNGIVFMYNYSYPIYDIDLAVLKDLGYNIFTTNTTIPTAAVEGSMYGAVGTSAEITLLTTQFVPAQAGNAISHGFNPLVYVTEALGFGVCIQQ